MTKSVGTSLFEKIWESHVIAEREGGEALLYIDRNLLHEGPFYAFDALAKAGRKIHRPLQTLAFSDHYVPTTGRHLGSAGIKDGEARVMVEQLARNSLSTGIVHFGIDDAEQGVMHVAGPELGLCEPGMIMAGADSHTSTNGAFGIFGFGVGASQVTHIMATQTVWFARPKTMRISVDGTPGALVTGKDLILAIIAQIGIDGGSGHVIEYAGSAISALSMEERMTVCNMSIEAGARSGMMSPDQKTWDYLAGCRYAPKGPDLEAAMAFWRTLPTDVDACFDREVLIDGNAIEPMVTWGTNQDEAVGISGRVPDPTSIADAGRRERAAVAQDYMRLKPGTAMRDVAVDRVFIGSCTNARLDDLRVAARLAQGRTARVPTIVVPGSRSVKGAAEREGLHEIFMAAGFEWRDAGCSMCTGSNGDRVPSGERCASTSNRNFEGRQGRGSLTHLVSPASAVAAAITGRLADPREFA